MNGWDKKDAEKLGGLAKMVINGKADIQSGYWSDDVLRFIME